MFAKRQLVALLQSGDLEGVRNECFRYGIIEGDSRWTEVDGASFRATVVLLHSLRWSFLCKNGETTEAGFEL